MVGSLPAKFLEKMEMLLGEQFDKFMNSYDTRRFYGLRTNPLKLNLAGWQAIMPFDGTFAPIPWAEDGYYYEEEARPGKHPYYNAGLYYIQEPSAMLPVELLDVKPGHRVLDLCAAPGGKSTQIGGKLRGRGVLVANDLALERTKPLAKNIELAGIKNAIVMNEEPERLAEVFEAWFDRILVDAPCSGEGMFRKNEAMIAEWEKHSIGYYSAMQQNILGQAAAMLAPGGLLVYSTCTFSPEENEDQIARFLIDHPDFAVEAIEPRWGLRPGRPDWIAEELASALGSAAAQSLAGTIRIWPHEANGEGHYAAALRKRTTETPGITAKRERADQATDDTAPPLLPAPEGGKSVRGRKASSKDAAGHSGKNGNKRPAAADPRDMWLSFAAKELRFAEEEAMGLATFGSHLYLQPNGLPSLDRLRVTRAGWHVGEIKHGRFVPSQQLALALTRRDCVRSVSWGADGDQLARYLRGETLFLDEAELEVAEGFSAKGYTLVCVDGYAVGWAKYADGMLKNELAPGWRKI